MVVRSSGPTLSFRDVIDASTTGSNDISAGVYELSGSIDLSSDRYFNIVVDGDTTVFDLHGVNSASIRVMDESGLAFKGLLRCVDISMTRINIDIIKMDGDVLVGSGFGSLFNTYDIIDVDQIDTARSYPTTTITGCSNNIPVAGVATGGLVGSYVTNLILTECINNAEITGISAGGLVGFGSAGYDVSSEYVTGTYPVTLNNCVNNGEILNADAGGLVGGHAGVLYSGYPAPIGCTNIYVTFNDCSNNGDTIGGGFCGVNAGSNDTYNYGTIFGAPYSVKFNNCDSFCNVTSSGAGGFIANATCYTTVDLSGCRHVGGTIDGYNCGSLYGIYVNEPIVYWDSALAWCPSGSLITVTNSTGTYPKYGWQNPSNPPPGTPLTHDDVETLLASLDDDEQLTSNDVIYTVSGLGQVSFSKLVLCGPDVTTISGLLGDGDGIVFPDGVSGPIVINGRTVIIPSSFTDGQRLELSPGLYINLYHGSVDLIISSDADLHVNRAGKHGVYFIHNFYLHNPRYINIYSSAPV